MWAAAYRKTSISRGRKWTIHCFTVYGLLVCQEIFHYPLLLAYAFPCYFFFLSWQFPFLILRIWVGLFFMYKCDVPLHFGIENLESWSMFEFESPYREQCSPDCSTLATWQMESVARKFSSCKAAFALSMKIYHLKSLSVTLGELWCNFFAVFSF
jgi:hypothetical protein